MGKTLRILIIICLSIFSFYYTNKIVHLSEDNDQLMKRIIKENQGEVKSVNGVISANYLLVGKSGKKIDQDLSYANMKALGIYNENFLEYKEIKPSINKKNNYDKVIIGSKTKEKEIAFIFQNNNIFLIEEVIYILNQTNTPATFFIDGKEIEANTLKSKELFKNNIYLGIYSYNDYFNRTSTSYMNRLIKFYNSTSYCLYKDDKFLLVCEKNKINTVKGKRISNNLYNYLKNNKKSGYIYEIELNKNNIKELNSAIMYLKQKGYKIISLDYLLKE